MLADQELGDMVNEYARLFDLALNSKDSNSNDYIKWKKQGEKIVNLIEKRGAVCERSAMK